MLTSRAAQDGESNELRLDYDVGQVIAVQIHNVNLYLCGRQLGQHAELIREHCRIVTFGKPRCTLLGQGLDDRTGILNTDRAQQRANLLHTLLHPIFYEIASFDFWVS